MTSCECLKPDESDDLLLYLYLKDLICDKNNKAFESFENNIDSNSNIFKIIRKFMFYHKAMFDIKYWPVLWR